MKRKLSSILIVAIFLVGLGIMLYPIISNLYSENNQIQAINKYAEVVKNMDNEEINKAKESAKAYNEHLTGNVIITDPFDAEAQKKLNENYEELLNLSGDGSMGYIEIPKIDVNLAIYHGTEEDVLKKGVGHLENTSIPIGGEGTHAVLSSHTGLPTAKLFNRLSDLENGDKFYLHILGETLAYEVDQIKVVEPQDTSDLVINSMKDYTTLVTCTPYGINSHRLLVRGIRIPYVEEKENEVTPINNVSTWYTEYRQAFIIGIGLIIILFIIGLIFKRNRKKKEYNSKI